VLPLSCLSGRSLFFLQKDVFSADPGGRLADARRDLYQSLCIDIQSLRSQNNGNRLFDAEQLGVNWATDTLNEYTRSGIQAKYNVTLVTQYFPCDFCEEFVDKGWWKENLEAGANGKVDVEYWHYTDQGQFVRFWPERP
jgi:hypothetical protein